MQLEGCVHGDGGCLRALTGDEAKRKSQAQWSWLGFALEEYITFLKDEKGEALLKVLEFIFHMPEIIEPTKARK